MVKGMFCLVPRDGCLRGGLLCCLSGFGGWFPRGRGDFGSWSGCRSVDG
jgi:hypothetical protein